MTQTVADGQVSARQDATIQQIRKGYRMFVRRGQTMPARIEKHDSDTKQMWEQLRRSENRTKKNAAPKLNHQSEERLRSFKEHRKQRQVRQRQQQQQKKQDRKPQKRSKQQPGSKNRDRAKRKAR